MAQTWTRTCKLESCQKEFTSKRKSQEFCCAKHRQEHFMLRKFQLEYQRGQQDAAKLIWNTCLQESKDVCSTEYKEWGSGLQRACSLIEEKYKDIVFHVEHSKAKAASA